MLKVGINGTGRIGICTARVIGSRKDIELVCVNTTADIDTLLHLLKYDSVHGYYDTQKIDRNTLRIGNSRNVKVISNRDIRDLDFGDAECILECTGKFNSAEKSSQHVKGKVKKVVISAPVGDALMLVYGVNHNLYKNESVVSNASCTTNCLAPIVKVLHKEFGIVNGLMTTIHSYTNDQNILDVRHKDKRRARAAALNMIPTSTGAAKAIGRIIPELDGKMNGIAVRVPTPNVSLVDVNLNVTKNVTRESVNQVLAEASKGEMLGIMDMDGEERVSCDFVGSSLSSIVVSDKTMCIGDSIKVLAWYDNEMGYSHRMVDICLHICK